MHSLDTLARLNLEAEQRELYQMRYKIALGRLLVALNKDIENMGKRGVYITWSDETYTYWKAAQDLFPQVNTTISNDPAKET